MNLFMLVDAKGELWTSTEIDPKFPYEEKDIPVIAKNSAALMKVIVAKLPEMWRTQLEKGDLKRYEEEAKVMIALENGMTLLPDWASTICTAIKYLDQVDMITT